MRGFRQWMSDHSEITGIVIFILIAAVVAGAAYGISYAVSGGSGKKVKTEQTSSSSGATSAAPESSQESQTAEISSGAQPDTQQPSSAASSGQEPSNGETTAAAVPTAGNSASAPSVGDTINEYGVYFQIVDESVTAKIETNLRRVPSTNNDEDVVATIYNGDWIKRTGIGHNGWSRVEYEGQVLYAVTSYLSTDGSSSSEPTYEENNDNVTAKEEVYLRTSPDSASDSNIAATLMHGDVITRVGIGSNGWSKLNYNGAEVYAVTSLLEVVQ